MGHIFIGIKVPDSISITLHNWSDYFQSRIPLKQWTHQKDYHITLAFLGDSSKGDYEQLKRNLSHITEISSFPLQIAHCGTFGNPKTPRVLWAGVEKETQLFALQKKVYQACTEAGYKLDSRPYRPHITLGKKWGGNAPQEFSLDNEQKEDKELSWVAKEFVIFEIQPNLSPKYHPIEHYLLK